MFSVSKMNYFQAKITLYDQLTIFDLLQVVPLCIILFTRLYNNSIHNFKYFLFDEINANKNLL